MNWFDPHSLLDFLGTFAVVGVAVLIFIETATIIGSILPGDSLLFLLGMTLATKITWFPLPIAMLAVLLGAIVGAQVGFWLGHKFGRGMFTKEKAWFFTPKTVERTRGFLDKYGARALILARFVPVIRAVMPTFAGIADMPVRRFFTFNVIGAVAWVIGLMGLGYGLGLIPFVQQNFEIVVLVFVILSSLPMPLELLRERVVSRRRAKKST
jgi:membrane-associated protein